MVVFWENVVRHIYALFDLMMQNSLKRYSFYLLYDIVLT